MIASSTAAISQDPNPGPSNKAETERDYYIQMVMHLRHAVANPGTLQDSILGGQKRGWRRSMRSPRSRLLDWKNFRHSREFGSESKRRLTLGDLSAFLRENYLEIDPLLIGALNPSHSSGVNVSRSTFSNRPL